MRPGSDILGPVQSRWAEVALKARRIGPHQVILAATRANAEMPGLADRIGRWSKTKRPS